ncbi:MAG: B12-binding domain-containing radical SAM protein [Chloroflexi bacterium]|nr:B12-binding domain-containing radical SAM protein [Chloroflexota bacterium]
MPNHRNGSLKVRLIAPAREEPLHSRTMFSVAPPLGLAVLASVTPPEVEISLGDENLHPIDFDEPADLVGITVSTNTAPRAYQLADAFRARGVKVVLGGMHTTALPEEAAQHADAVVTGEAEETWPQLLADMRNGGLQPGYHNQKLISLAGLPTPRRDLLREEGYLFPKTVITSRGCPNACTFCAVTSYFGRSYRFRPTEEVGNEIAGLGDHTVFFVDDNIAPHPRHAKELFKSLIPYKLSWVGQASLTIARDEEVLRLAAASGCVALFIGIESVLPDSLGAVGKRCNVVAEYEEAIRRIHAAGIAVFGAFIFGFDNDTEDVFEQTVRFARQAHLEGAQFNILTPYPGTPIFRDLDREGRIFQKDWGQYRGDTVLFEPRRLSPGKLQEGHDWAWREFYSLGSIWERIGLLHKNALLIWAINVNYRNGPLSKYLLEPLISLSRKRR